MYAHHRQLAVSLLFFALPCTYFLKLKTNADNCMPFINSKRNPVGIQHLFALQACSKDAFHKLHTQNRVTDMQRKLIG